MLIMRIKTNFAKERESEAIMYKPKFFIASEGVATEPRYFEKLNQSIISDNVTIINILRDYVDLGRSNPTFIVDLLKTFIENSSNEVTIKELKRKLKNWDHENPNKINLVNTFDKLSEMYPNDYVKVKYDALNDLFMELFKAEIYEDVALNFIKYFEAQDVTYSKITDTLNIVIDRDEGSFFPEQYDRVKSFCESNNVNLFVSNPNFEFWLFLHFPEIENEDRTLLHTNPKVGKRRYLEKRLNEIFKYNKKSYSFEELEPRIVDAIEREAKYEESIEGLKTNLGTNVGKLVKKIMEVK